MSKLTDWIFRRKSATNCSTEGQVRPSFGFGELGTMFRMRELEDGFQRNLTGPQRDRCGAVYACKNVYAQAIATMPVYHQRLLDEGGKERRTDSPMARVMRSPNDYQTRSDFMLNLVFELLSHGNAYAVAYRDGSERISELHLVPANNTMPYVNREDGAIFYGVGDNQVINLPQALIPQRDVLHIRLHTPDHPLQGVSPIKYAAAAIAVNTAISGNQAHFFNNLSRPSGVLTTDERMSKAQMDDLRERWKEKSVGVHAGDVPILSWGLKWNPMTLTSEDAQLVEAYKMTVEDIGRVFRVPMPLLGDANTTYNTTQQLIEHWMATGLGFLMEHIEGALAKLFRLDASDSAQFDQTVLLRTDFQSRIDGLSKAVSNGIMSPNEAREIENLPPVEFGEEPRVQAQNVPLSQVAMSPTAPAAPSAPAPELEALPQDSEQQTRAAKRAILEYMHG